MESVVKQKLKEAEEADPGYITILGKSVHRENNWLGFGIFICIIIVSCLLAVILPKLFGYS